MGSKGLKRIHEHLVHKQTLSKIIREVLFNIPNLDIWIVGEQG